MALTREVSSTMAACELTYAPRMPIDVERARREHRAYEAALVECGCTVRRLTSGDDMPDAVFVEDAALVFDEIAVMTRPGAEPRRIETRAVADALREYRPLGAIEAPGTMDGGDVLLVGRMVYVGRSTRTNDAAVEQLRSMLRPFGYTVVGVTVGGCLHLKSAATLVGEGILLINPRWLSADTFDRTHVIEVDPDEPHAANALLVGHRVIYPSTYPRTQARLEAGGISLRLVDAGELAKAEGAVTCCSLIFRT